MITALQNFISKKGKFVFVLLLFVVVISFVLYLAQGTSIFDLLPDPNREKKEFYGYDLNNPDEMRILSIENRVASDFGAVIPPLEDSMLEADKKFFESLQAQLQKAFQADQGDIDRSALQRLFGFMQSWPNLPKNFKAQEISRSGIYDPVFSQAAIRAKLVMEGQARSWSYLADTENHIGVNDGFNRYVRELDPSLISDENRSRALRFVGTRQGVRTSFVESTLFSHFRANQVDRIYSDAGFTLEKEGEIDLYSNQFAWKAELLSLKLTEIEYSNPALFEFKFSKQPSVNDSIRISYGTQSVKILFVNQSSDQNSTDMSVQLGSSLTHTTTNLVKALNSKDFDFECKKSNKNTVIIIPGIKSLPQLTPQVSSSSQAIAITNLLTEQLKGFHEESKNDPIFTQPARTFATMIRFPSSNFLSIPPEPKESRLRGYYDLNRDQFDPVPNAPDPNVTDEGENGPKGDSNSSIIGEQLDLISSASGDSNQTQKKEVSFEDVKAEIRLRIIEEDRLDAERDAKELAREASLQFLDQINSLRDQLNSKYSNFIQRRNSNELNSLIAESGGVAREISFSEKDMNVQSAILGIERRESERRNNREPLQEVSALNERLFFTRSSRTVRDGYAVFVLDRKTKEEAGTFEKASFADLYREYSNTLRSDAFNDWTEQTYNGLLQDESNQTLLQRGSHIKIDAKSLSALQSSFDSQNQRLKSRLGKLESERGEISKAERESNATAPQVARKVVLDQLIDDLRNEQDESNENRTLSVQLAEACPNLTIGSGWSELERTEDLATYVKLSDVYSLKATEVKKEDVVTRVSEIERSRAESARDLILENLLQGAL
ncbi:MAG: hypothetical protein P8P49_12520 [Opitutales bacterium]|nr:hypothetical protein [Opitutales bacterium]